MEELTLDSLKTLDTNSIAFNKDRLGPLVFEQSAPLLEKLIKLANELDELGYKENLSAQEANEIDSFKNNLIEHLRRIQNFDINQPNPKETHDNYETQILSFYNDTTRQLRQGLVYLRQEAQYKTRDQKSLKKLQQETLQARKKFEELSIQLKKEIETLEKRRQQVESKHGEIAAKVLANHFAKQANDYTKDAEKWSKTRDVFYWILIGIIILNFIIYLVLFVANKFFDYFLKTTDFFTIEYGLTKLVLLSLLSYGIAFASKNYSVSSNLSAINRHRKNVAQTLDDFLETKPESEVRSQMIKEGTLAMFKHLPIGYIGKNEAKESSPVHEIINMIKP